MAHNVSGLCYNVNSIDRGGIRWLPCSWVNSFKRINQHLSLPSLKHYNSYFLGSFTAEKHFYPVLRSRTASLFSQPSSMLSRRACQVTSEDSGETSSGESIMLDEQTLMQNLQIAILEENCGQAAKIRDHLRLLKEDSKAAVLATNARFYKAFRDGSG